MSAAVVVLVAAHLVPLPNTVWSTLPGRELILQIDAFAQLGSVWRPLTMVPSGTWNALYSLAVPLAVLLLAVQLDEGDRVRLLTVVAGIGLFSGILGLIQVVGSPTGSLYLYRITNNGSAVGLFSNRNHAAVLLAALFPMLAVFASVGIKTEEQAKLKAWACLAAGGVLIPLVLVTGSRAGLITAAIGLAIAPFLYVRPSIVRPKKRRTNRVSPAIGLVALGALALVLITVLFFRAQAFERLAAPDQTEDLRFQIWGPIMATGWQHFPIGSGVGTFPEVYQVHERFELLSPNYVNHAHNDFLEVFTTAGLPGVLLIAAAGLALIRGASKAWRAPREGGAERALGRLGSVILLLLALASLVDYPLRVPSLMGLAVIAAVWLSGPGNAKQAASRTPIDR